MLNGNRQPITPTGQPGNATATGTLVGSGTPNIPWLIMDGEVGAAAVCGFADPLAAHPHFVIGHAPSCSHGWAGVVAENGVKRAHHVVITARLFTWWG